MTTEPKYEAPGPGPWELEAVHMQRPVSTFAAEAYTRAFPRGFSSSTARYGLLLSHIQPAVVNGFMYMQAVPYGAPPGASGPPPKPILWLLTRLHPKMRARIAACAQAFETKQWREDLRRWDAEYKPNAIAKHRKIQDRDVQKLTDQELIAYVKDCHDHMEDMVALHHEFTATCVVATGDYLAQTHDWTKASMKEMLGLLRGSSPISNGVAAEELTQLAAAIRKDDRAKALLEGADSKQALAALADLEGDVGACTRAYLDVVRYRSLGYDVADKAAGEMPELLLRAIRAAATNAGSRDDQDEREQKTKALRERVPAEHRERFDEVLTEARHVNRLRDERGVYSDGWGTGLARRALLEVGRRLAETGKLDNAEHAVDLTHDEIKALLGGAKGPSRDAVKKRVLWRTTKTVADAPPWLNAPPSGPPPADLLPGAARRAARAVGIFMDNMFKEDEAEAAKEIVRGQPVNAGVYEGRARIVGDANEFHKIERGDVLVARATSPYFNVVLPLLGAIVTDRGGQLSHAAIVAREYGIPGVVGTREATKKIPDGARVRVDGAAGEVTVLGRPE